MSFCNVSVITLTTGCFGRREPAWARPVRCLAHGQEVSTTRTGDCFAKRLQITGLSAPVVKLGIATAIRGRCGLHSGSIWRRLSLWFEDGLDRFCLPMPRPIRARRSTVLLAEDELVAEVKLGGASHRRIFDTPPLKGYTFVYFGSRRSTCYRSRGWFGWRQQT